MSLNKKRIFLNILASILLISCGAGFMVLMVKNRKVPSQKETVNKGVLVRTIKAEKTIHRIELNLTGIVNIFEKARISSEVSGVVQKINKNLEKGGYIKKGEILFELDPFNYRIIVESAKSKVAKAESELEKIESESLNAKNEWQTFNPGIEPPTPLIYMIPQVNAAKAALKSAKADLKKARNDLKKTKIESPFNAIVLDENVSTGVFITQSSSVATLIPSDKRDLIIPVPVSDLKYITDKQGQFLDRNVTVSIPETETTFEGEIVRTLPDVDERIKMYRLLVRIRDLYKKYGELSFLLADKSFVSSAVHGQEIENAYTIPSQALRGSSSIWLMTRENRLKMINVKLIMHRNEKAVIQAEIENDAEIITTPVNGAVNNMLLRKRKGSIN